MRDISQFSVGFTFLEAWMVRLPVLEVSVSLEVHVHNLVHTYAPVKQNVVQMVLHSAHLVSVMLLCTLFHVTD